MLNDDKDVSPDLVDSANLNEAVAVFTIVHRLHFDRLIVQSCRKQAAIYSSLFKKFQKVFL